MDAKKVLQEIISEIIKPEFKKINFKTSGTTFLKEENGFVKVFTIQSSRFNNADAINFTFNIGFFFPFSYRLFSTLPYPKSIKESDCQTRFRSGQLTRNEKDFWYKINKQVSLENLKIDIYTDVKTIIEFFQKFDSVTDLINLNSSKYWGANRVELDTSLALVEQGRIEEANKLFNNYYKNYKGNESWLQKLEYVANKTGLTLNNGK